MRRRVNPLKLSRDISDVAIYEFYRALDCPRSLACYLMFKYKEYDQLVSIDCNPSDYANPLAFRAAFRATSFLSKNRFLKSSIDTKALALEKFHSSERKCKVTNRKWIDRREFSLFDWNSISRVSEKIYRIIGPRPNIDRIIDRSSWGPGASLSIQSRVASNYKKYRDERGITIDARGLCEHITTFYPLIQDRMFQYELGDRIVVVPKNSKIDRVILIQPGWNLWFQKGCGLELRSLLKNFGLDLNNSDKRNRELAKRSSVDGSLATIDFSSASDQIAIEPLREVLPPDWFNILDGLRSKRSADGSYTWEKFSSMGNGFTFELETLIFYCIALVSCDIESIDSDDVSVFGDDVIIPSGAVDTFRRISTTFGFTLNDHKSFSDGPFRESCGSYYYSGVDCKPYFLKEKIIDITALYKFANSIRYLAHIDAGKIACDKAWKGCYNRLKRFASPGYKLFVPFGVGDCGFASNFDEATPRKSRHGWEGFLTKALVAIPLTYEDDNHALLCVRLREHSDRARNNAIELKSRVRLSRRDILIHEWYDLGPWI